MVNIAVVWYDQFFLGGHQISDAFRTPIDENSHVFFGRITLKPDNSFYWQLQKNGEANLDPIDVIPMTFDNQPCPCYKTLRPNQQDTDPGAPCDP